MANKVLLISESTLKKYTMCNDNLDSKYVLPAISITQDCDLDTIIGPALNRRLQALVENGDINEEKNSAYKNLLDEYITPYLCWQVMAAIQVNINYKLTNSGTIQNNDDKKSNIDFNNGNALITQYEHYAQSYANKLSRYLLKNVNLFPEYRQCENFEYSEQPQLCSIYLPEDGYDGYIGK